MVHKIKILQKQRNLLEMFISSLKNNLNGNAKNFVPFLTSDRKLYLCSKSIYIMKRSLFQHIEII